MDDYFKELVALHRPNVRQGPGSESDTLRALELSGVNGGGLRVADIGSGTGASALILAEHLDAEVLAIDLFPEFLDELKIRATERGLSSKIVTKVASMEALDLEPASLDLIWSEGAIFSMGFEAGVAAWTPFLKHGGVLAVSELTWLSAERPEGLTEHWKQEYPEVGFNSEKFAILEKFGLIPIGYFVLPKTSWTQNYYEPLKARLDELERGCSHVTDAIIVETELEIALYERYSDYFSYGFCLARKVESPAGSVKTITLSD